VSLRRRRGTFSTGRERGFGGGKVRPSTSYGKGITFNPLEEGGGRGVYLLSFEKKVCGGGGEDEKAGTVLSVGGGEIGW